MHRTHIGLERVSLLARRQESLKVVFPSAVAACGLAFTLTLAAQTTNNSIKVKPRGSAGETCRRSRAG